MKKKNPVMPVLLIVLLLFFVQCSKTKKKYDVDNLILVVIDALRADHVGAYNYARDTTPNIDTLARHSLTCLNAYSQSNWTSPSMASIFTGTYMFIHKIFNSPNKLKGRYAVLPADFTIIPEALKSRGLYTVGFTSHGWVSKESNYDQGFDQLEVLERKDSVIIDRAVNFVKENNQKFFLYLHLLDLHDYIWLRRGPGKFLKPSYELSEEIKGLHGRKPNDIVKRLGGVKEPGFISKEDLSYLIDKYDSLLFYTDRLIGKLTKALREKNILDKTVIIITADHGERFFEHNELSHGGESLYNEVVHVPLIIHNKMLFPGQRKVSGLVETIDIFATILDLFSIADIKVGGITQLQGTSILKPDKEKIVYIENSNRTRVKLIKDNWSYIYHKKGKIKRKELYNLAEDPFETKNVAEKYISITNRMFKLMKDRIKKGAQLSQKIDPRKVRIKKKTKEALKSLGYLD